MLLNLSSGIRPSSTASETQNDLKFFTLICYRNCLINGKIIVVIIIYIFMKNRYTCNHHTECSSTRIFSTLNIFFYFLNFFKGSKY